MKSFSFLLFAAAAALLLVGAIMAVPASGPNSDDSALLRASKSLLSSCETLNRTAHLVGEAPTDCSAERERYETRLSEAAAQNTSNALVGYGLISLAFFITIHGTILYAAGKIEATIKASTGSTSTDAPPPGA